MREAEKEVKIKDTKEFSARLMAVQAYYQNSQNLKPMAQVIEEYLLHPPLMDVDGEEISKPHGGLFKRILTSLNQRLAEVEEILKAHLPENKVVEPLLKAIIICGIVEILEHTDIDAPIIIDDYLNVTHAFYEQQQVSLVNGILDKASSAIRG